MCVCVCVCLYCEDKLLGRKILVGNSGIGTTMSSHFVHKNLVGIAERSSLIHGSGFFLFKLGKIVSFFDAIYFLFI